MWRPSNWPEDPCDDCPDKVVDDYGYFCCVACDKRQAWLSREAGADAILTALLGRDDFPNIKWHEIFAHKEEK